MPGSGQAYKIGPFVGGINRDSDPSAVADVEMVDCVNFDVNIDGTLISRPPISETAGNFASWTERIVIIGRASFAGEYYLIGSNSNGTYYFDGTSWTLILANLESRVALQYHDKVWILAVPNCAVKGGSWAPSTGFVVDDAMPQGEAAVFHKARLFVVPGISATTNPSRLQFTDPISSTVLTWDPVNIVDVSPGDGENLVDVIVYNDNLMLLKQDSTYILAYDILPSDAILREINTTIGVSTRNCVVQFENSVFLYHEGNVYEIVNYDFQRINYKVPLEYSTTGHQPREEQVFLCVLGDRMIVRYFGRLYVYGFKTKTWTRWESSNYTLNNFGPLTEFPANPTESQLTRYYAGSSIGSDTSVVMIQDGYDSLTSEDTITCSVVTKSYDMLDPLHFKKLMWWGADVSATENIIGSVWSLSRGKISEVTTVAEKVANVEHQFARFRRALRFKDAYFKIELTTNGTTVSGPARLFSIAAIVATKQGSDKEVN